MGAFMRLGYQWENSSMLFEPLALELDTSGYGFTSVVGVYIPGAENMSIGSDSGYRFNHSQCDLDKSTVSSKETGDYSLKNEALPINFTIIYHFNDPWELRHTGDHHIVV
jgi:hypothetical protein